MFDYKVDNSCTYDHIYVKHYTGFMQLYKG